MRTFCLLLAVVHLGCYERNYAVNQQSGRTSHYLHLWGDYVKQSYELGFKVDEKKSLQEAVFFLKGKHVLEESLSEYMKLDGWDRPFQWTSTRDENGTKVRILSFGPDGIDQDGHGDDLFVVVTVPKKGPVAVSYR